VTYGYLFGVTKLDTVMEIELESDNEEGVVLVVKWSLRDLLE
jgi:hypothetical protein